MPVRAGPAVGCPELRLVGRQMGFLVSAPSKSAGMGAGLLGAGALQWAIDPGQLGGRGSPVFLQFSRQVGRVVE